jgi:hypothetical protein
VSGGLTAGSGTFNGAVGIGTTSPGDILHLAKDNILRPRIQSASATTYLKGILDFYRSRGTVASPAAVAANDDLGSVSFFGYDGSAFKEAAFIKATVPDGTTVGANDLPSEMLFYTTPDGSATPALCMKLASTGNATFSGSLTAASGVFSSASGDIQPILKVENTITNDYPIFVINSGTVPDNGGHLQDWNVQDTPVAYLNGYGTLWTTRENVGSGDLPLTGGSEITIGNEGALDLYSNNITHGVTTVLPTNVHGRITHQGTVEGEEINYAAGMKLIGIGGFESDDHAPGITVYGIKSSDASSYPPSIKINSAVKSGDSVVAVNDAYPMVSFNNNGTQKVTVYGNGDITTTGSLTAANKITTDTLLADSCFRLPMRVTDCPMDGSMWYVEGHGSIHTYIDGVVSSMNRTLFVQTDTKLDSNSTAETSLIGTSPIHNLDSFPARYFLIGKTHKFYMAGIYSTKAPTTGNLIIKFSMNATPLCSTTIVLDANETDQTWSMTGFNTCIDTGSSGKFRLATGFEHTIAGVSHNDRIATPNGGATVNTTVKLVPRITARFTTADVSNKIKSTQFIIEELH